MTFVIEATPLGADLVLQGSWNHSAEDALVSGAATGLILNYARGFRERDLEFLRGLPVQRLTILARTLKDLSPVYSLAETLTSLKVEVDPRAEIDLYHLQRLAHLSAHWAQVRTSVGSLDALEQAFFLNYDEPDLLAFANSSSLQSLDLKDGPRLQTLDGIEALPRLGGLGLFGADRLIDFSALGRLQIPSLHRLQIPYCRGINNLAVVTRCEALVFLDASECGDIESASPLVDLPSLEKLHVYGTTRFVDPDLTYIDQLPRLTDFRIQSRREYTPKVSEIQDHLRQRSL